MNFDGQTAPVDQDGYTEAIDYLYALQFHGIKLGLRNIQRLLVLLGEPERSFRSVHIAGTNGKGSTSSFIASILRSAGYRVGHFTSPHLVSFTERIRVNGTMISRDDVVRITALIRDLIGNEKDFTPTFFEFVTAMAFHYFREHQVQYAVVETGMGGRLDATNILEPEATVITSVSMDHMEFLGHTLEEITGEKAGIVKDDTPLIVGKQDEKAIKIIMDEAWKKKATPSVYGKDFHGDVEEIGTGGSRFHYRSKDTFPDLTVPLCGRFQIENAAVAIRTIEMMGDADIPEGVIREGLASTRWEGRCERLNWKYPILFDGAHNQGAAAALAETLRMIFLMEFSDIIFIIGAMGDKEVEGYFKVLLPLGRLTIFTTLRFARAARSDDLLQSAETLGVEAVATDDMAHALKTAEERYKDGDLVVITGSFYAVGEAKGVIGADTSLMDLTEFK